MTDKVKTSMELEVEKLLFDICIVRWAKATTETEGDIRQVVKNMAPYFLDICQVSTKEHELEETKEVLKEVMSWIHEVWGAADAGGEEWKKTQARVDSILRHEEKEK